MRRRWAVAALALLVVGLAGCGPDHEVRATTADPTPFAACPEESSPAASAAAGGRPMPSVSLPCFVGDRSVDLSRLGRPVVINFWASFCRPCRQELPELQRFADEAAGAVDVVGVITGDQRSAAAWAGHDFGVSFPAVFDPKGLLLRDWGRTAIPITLFVDASGTVRHEDVSGALTLTRLKELARTHLGVVVT